MSGHSRWTQIKHKKTKTDEKRGRVFGKLIKNILITARTDANPETNTRLRAAIHKAHAHAVPRDTIERALAGAAKTKKGNLNEILLGIHGPENANALIEVITDNKNRTVAELRVLSQKFGWRIVSEESVRWNYTYCGVITLAPQTNQIKDINELSLLAIDAGADDISLNKNNDQILIITKPESMNAVRNALTAAHASIENTSLQYIPRSLISLPTTQHDQAKQFLQTILNHADVQNVYTNIVLK